LRQWRRLWGNKNAEPEKIEGQVWIAGNLMIRNTKVLNADPGKTGDPAKTEENLFNGTMDSALGSLAP
jgi:hypothetical protein